jgi:hypothetical protein
MHLAWQSTILCDELMICHFIVVTRYYDTRYSYVCTEITKGPSPLAIRSKHAIHKRGLLSNFVFSKRFMKPSKKVIFWNCFYNIVLQNHSFVHHNRSRGVLRKIFRQKSRVPLKFARRPNPPIILTMILGRLLSGMVKLLRWLNSSRKVEQAIFKMNPEWLLFTTSLDNNAQCMVPGAIWHITKRNTNGS